MLYCVYRIKDRERKGKPIERWGRKATGPWLTEPGLPGCRLGESSFSQRHLRDDPTIVGQISTVRDANGSASADSTD